MRKTNAEILNDVMCFCEEHFNECNNGDDPRFIMSCNDCKSITAYDKGYEDGKKDAVKHGHWIWYYTSKQEMKSGTVMYTPHFMCSVCEHKYESYRRYDEPKKEDADFPMYCENCGAKMDEEVE